MSTQKIDFSTNTKSGIQKGISQKAISLILDTIQITQYVKPVESTVRELATNAVDSQMEKEFAIDILGNQAPVSKYYIQRSGDLYTDSQWDPDYYDLRWLDRQRNHILLSYDYNVNGSDIGFCDTFSVTDYGVGIGLYRLEGYFDIGFSTKRNCLSSMGAFGYGSKVSFSLRNESYYMETAYNGCLFKFMCYVKGAESIVPAFDINGNNDYYEFANGYRAYFEKTESKNYTKIVVPCKSIHRERFKQAVSSQLLYFDNVEFEINNGSVYSVDVKSDILYQSDNIVISENNWYSRPHIIVTKPGGNTGICYGYIEFEELEMQKLNGNIGVKCPIRSVTMADDGSQTVLSDGITVTPSRESVVWDDNTRDYITKAFNNVVREATVIVEDRLQKCQDLRTWLSDLVSLSNYRDTHSVLHHLRGIVELQNIRPQFKDSSIFFDKFEDFFDGYKIRRISQNSWDKEIRRTKIESWSEFSLDLNNIYFKQTNTSVIKDSFLLTQNSVFIVIEPLPSKLEDEKYRLLEQSFISYDDFVVPEDFRIDELSYEENVAISRAKNNQVFYRLVIGGYSGNREDSIQTLFDHSQQYPDTMFKGLAKDQYLLSVADTICRSFYSSNSVMMKVSSLTYDKLSFVPDIKEFYDRNVDGVSTMHPGLIKFNTISMMKPQLHMIEFMNGFKKIDSEIYLRFQDLLIYINNMSHVILRQGHKLKDVSQYLQHMIELQKISHKEGLNSALEHLSGLIDDIEIEPEGFLAYDQKTIDNFNYLLEYAQPIQKILNNVPVMKLKHTDINDDLIDAVKKYIHLSY